MKQFDNIETEIYILQKNIKFYLNNIIIVYENENFYL